MTKYIDAHCHLNSSRDCVGIVNAAQMADWDDVVALLPRPVAIGIHPWYIDDLPGDWMQRLERLLADNPALMVGEIGLDRLHPDFAAQQEICAIQMEIAARYGRVAHVHVVRAWDVMLNILGKMRLLPPMIVMHGFRASPEIARDLMRYDNIYYSFSHAGPTAGVVSINRILIETDGVADVDLQRVVHDIANIRGMDPVQMAEIIYNNTMRIINHGQIKSD